MNGGIYQENPVPDLLARYINRFVCTYIGLLLRKGGELGEELAPNIRENLPLNSRRNEQEQKKQGLPHGYLYKKENAA